MLNITNFQNTNIDYVPKHTRRSEKEFTLSGPIAISCMYSILMDVGDSMVTYYNNNKEKLHYLRHKYAGGDVRADEFDMIRIAAEMMKPVSWNDLDNIMFDEAFLFLSVYCAQILWPQTRTNYAVEAVVKKLTAKQNHICPYCGKEIDLLTQKVNLSHLIGFNNVGNRLDSISLVAAHECCNQSAALRHNVASLKAIGAR